MKIMRARSLVPCACVGGKGTGKNVDNAACSTCLGLGFAWSDDQPATTCPGIAATAAPLKCDRHDDLCPSCLRLSATIPAVVDVIADRRRVGLSHERSAPDEPQRI